MWVALVDTRDGQRMIRPRRRGRPNTTQLLADYLEAHGVQRSTATPGTIEILGCHPKRKAFDSLNALGVLIVVMLLGGALYFCFRLCGLL